MLLVAVAAINWPGAIGLEGNLTCLSALCASGIVHLSRAAAVAASASASISFHLNSLTFGIDSVNRSYILQNIPSNSIEATLMQHHQSGLIALYTCWLTQSYPLYSTPTSSRMRSAILGPTMSTSCSSSLLAAITFSIDPKWRRSFLATDGPTLGMADMR